MAHGSVRDRDRQAGFTLIELVVVIGAIAFIMGMLTLGVQRASAAFSLRRAASVAISELRRAQAAAVAEGVDYTVEFIVSSPYGITVYRQTAVKRTVTGQEWPSSVAIRSSGSSVSNCTTPGSASNKCVTFRPLGFAVAGGRVRLRSQSSVDVDIEITAATGRVSIRP